MAGRAVVSKLNQVGDTIVEVMLSLAVLGMIIGTAFAIANRSLNRAQQSQERTQALKLAEGQVDSVKYLSESSNEADKITFESLQSATTNPRCLSSFTDDGKVSIKDYPADDANCQDGIFSYSMLYDQSKHIFNVRVVWDSLSGGQENVTIQYRVVQ